MFCTAKTNDHQTRRLTMAMQGKWSLEATHECVLVFRQRSTDSFEDRWTSEDPVGI